MPIYEYSCSKCGHRFEELVFSSTDPSTIRCPECGAKKPERLMSAFAMSGGGKGGGDCGPGGSTGFS